MNLEVLIMGDLNFAAEVMHGVARLFMGPNEASFHQATGVVLVIMLLFSSIRYFIDPEKSPYPFREFLYGLVAWIIFVGPVSPRFDVTLQSYHDPLAVRTVNDIPLLAAVPAWATSNLLGGLRELMQDSFSPVGFAAGDDVDPLGALVKLHSASLPYSASNGNASSDIDFSRSLDNYITECYIMEQKNSPSQSYESIQKLQSRPLDDLLPAIRVNTSHYATTLYLESSVPEGTFENCQDAHTKIVNYANGSVRDSLSKSYERIGVTENSLLTGQQLLTGGAGPIANPYDLMVNRMVLWHLGEGLQKNGYQSPWISKMLSEATTNRAYKSAAERAMFLEYVLPLTSMFEMFAFYIAPIMMILAVMGGIGWGMLSKYMYLLLFVNLWGFIKVFVDLYTYLAAEKAFDVIAVTDNPFTVANFSGTITEVESLLGVASNMTSAIPLLAMFLLYGGVHSLMGVMREMDPSGKGSVQADNMAPKVASPWNSGSMNIGAEQYTKNLRDDTIEQQHNLSTNQFYGTGSVGNSLKEAAGNTRQITGNSIESTGASYSEAASSMVQQMRSDITNESGGYTINSASDYVAAQVVGLSENIQENSNLTKEQADVLALETVQQEYQKGDAAASRDVTNKTSAGIEVGTFGKGLIGSGATFKNETALALGMKWTEGQGWTNMSAEKSGETSKDAYTVQEGKSWMQKFDENYQSSDKYSVGNNFTGTEQVSDTGQYGDSFNELAQVQKSFVDSVSESEAVNRGLNSSSDYNSSQALNKAGMGAMLHDNAEMMDTFYSKLTDDEQERLKNLGINDSGDILDRYRDESINPISGKTDAFKAMDLMMSELQSHSSGNSSDSIDEQKHDLSMMKKISDTFVETGAQESSSGYSSATLQGYKQLSSNLDDVIKTMDSDLSFDRSSYFQGGSVPSMTEEQVRGKADNNIDYQAVDLNNAMKGATQNSNLVGDVSDKQTDTRSEIDERDARINEVSTEPVVPQSPQEQTPSTDSWSYYQPSNSDVPNPDQWDGWNEERLLDSQVADLQSGVADAPSTLEHGGASYTLQGYRGDAEAPTSYYYQDDTTGQMQAIRPDGKMKEFYGDTDNFEDFTNTGGGYNGPFR